MMNDEGAQVSRSPPPAGHPPPPRRPRVREISSRFMSPAPSSSSSYSGDLHTLVPRSPKHPTLSPNPWETVQSRPPQQQHNQNRSKSAQRRLQVDPLSRSDENLPEIVRSLETPLVSFQRKPKPGKTLKENGGEQRQNPSDVSVSQSTKSLTNFKLSRRPDTPTVGATGGERVVSSRFRQPQSSNTVSAAAKLLQSSGMSMSSQLPPNPDTTSKEGLQDSGLDSRYSLQESDQLPKFSNRSSIYDASPCARSMTFPSSSGHHPKPPTNLAKSGSGSLNLPPPHGSKVGVESKKTRRGSGHQEDVHALRMLQNRLMQWRFINAKAEASMRTQKEEAEKTLHSAAVTIASKRDRVVQMRMEVERLKREEALVKVLKSNTPHLEEWSALEGEYTSSLSEATNALINASCQLPVTGNIQVNVGEIEEALNAAAKMSETIASCVENFVPKAEEVDALASQLARVVGAERGLVEECGDLLSKTHTSQTEECSLRGQLMQKIRSKQRHRQKK